MVLESLDPNDPKPRREEACFADDYRAFCKADQAWHKRERNRRKKLKTEHTEPALEPAPELMQQRARRAAAAA